MLPLGFYHPFLRPMLKKVLEKIGLNVHWPCHISVDHKTAIGNGPESLEIITSAP